MNSTNGDIASPMTLTELADFYATAIDGAVSVVRDECGCVFNEVRSQDGMLAGFIIETAKACAEAIANNPPDIGKLFEQAA